MSPPWCDGFHVIAQRIAIDCSVLLGLARQSSGMCMAQRYRMHAITSELVRSCFSMSPNLNQCATTIVVDAAIERDSSCQHRTTRADHGSRAFF